MYSQKISSGASIARTTMLGIVLLAAVCLASAAHPQLYSADGLAGRAVNPADDR